MRRQHQPFNRSFNTLTEVIEWGITKHRLTWGAWGSAAPLHMNARWLSPSSGHLASASLISFHTNSSVWRSVAGSLSEACQKSGLRKKSCVFDINLGWRAPEDDRGEEKKTQVEGRQSVTTDYKYVVRSSPPPPKKKIMERWKVIVMLRQICASCIIRVESICESVSQLRLGGLEAEAPQGIYTN